MSLNLSWEVEVENDWFWQLWFLQTLSETSAFKKEEIVGMSSVQENNFEEKLVVADEDLSVGSRDRAM